MAVARLEATTATELDYVTRNGRKAKKIGHNTVAKSTPEYNVIEYHGNEIWRRKWGERNYQITHAGWTTVTTSGRLNQLTTSQGGGWVNIRKGVMYYETPSGKVHEIKGWLTINASTGEVEK